MVQKIDARGLACPAPVLLTKDAIEREQPLSLEILVDNDGSRENVERFLGTKKYAVTVSRQGSDYLLSAAGGGQAGSEGSPTPVEIQSDPEAGSKKTLVVIAADRLGAGDDELGAKLMVAFVKTIKEMGDELWRLVFVNGGVKLTIENSPVLAELQAYEQAGTVIMACGTCLAHFGLSEQKRVGQTTNMLDIVTAMQLADKVISLG